MQHPSVALVHRLADAMNKGAWEEVGSCLADDVVWHEIGRVKPIRGKAAMAGSGSPDSTIHIALHDVVANDNHAVALCDVTAKRGRRTLKYRTAEIYHIRDGRITERWAMSDDTAAINAFFA